MKQDHMIGITPAYDGPNYEMIRQLGVKWVREGFAFPFSEEGAGKVSKAFLCSEEKVMTFIREGFGVLASFPGPGSMRYVPSAGKTVYYRAMPLWMGDPSEDGYYEALYEAARWLGERTRGTITWWQVANEPDIDIFQGPLTDAQSIRYLMTVANGLKAGNPEAKCGINLGYINDKARLLMKEMYAIENSPFEATN